MIENKKFAKKDKTKKEKQKTISFLDVFFDLVILILEKEILILFKIRNQKNDNKIKNKI